MVYKKIGGLKEETMTTQQDFLVLEVLGEVESLLYRCPACGEKIGVLPHELNEKHICRKCGKEIDCAKCPHYVYGRGSATASR
jgi:rRNA maturation endonuclease Nob1